MKSILLIIIIGYYCLINAQNCNQKYSIVILPPDVAKGYDQAGCTNDPLEKLKDYLKTDTIFKYIQLNEKRLKAKKIEILYIFNKKYCKPIAKEMQVDFIIMSYVELVKRAENKNCLNNDIYNIKGNYKASCTRIILCIWALVNSKPLNS